MSRRLELTLPDDRVLRMCFACGVNEHEHCAKDPAVCNGCAVCLSGTTPKYGEETP